MKSMYSYMHAKVKTFDQSSSKREIHNGRVYYSEIVYAYMLASQISYIH
jgi:hypothetical protein